MKKIVFVASFLFSIENFYLTGTVNKGLLTSFKCTLWFWRENKSGNGNFSALLPPESIFYDANLLLYRTRKTQYSFCFGKIDSDKKPINVKKRREI